MMRVIYFAKICKIRRLKAPWFRIPGPSYTMPRQPEPEPDFSLSSTCGVRFLPLGLREGARKMAMQVCHWRYFALPEPCDVTGRGFPTLAAMRPPWLTYDVLYY